MESVSSGQGEEETETRGGGENKREERNSVPVDMKVPGPRRLEGFSYFTQTFEEYFGFTDKKAVKEGKKEDDPVADEQCRIVKEEASYALPPAIVLELESLGFVDGEKNEVREEKNEAKQEKQEKEITCGWLCLHPNT